jgi:alkylation response protein AidB-like acyl-CoA dehydrogenase
MALVDGGRVCDIELADVELSADCLIGPEGEADGRLAAAFDAGVAALCAESLGIQRKLLDASVEYSKQRRQFGRAIGEFQVLQHRMADMFIKVEESASMTYVATLRLSAPPAERAAEVSAAKVAVDQAARFVGQAAVQIHGGMGITKELPVADCFARLTMIAQELGSTDFHLRRYETYSFAA